MVLIHVYFYQVTMVLKLKYAFYVCLIGQHNMSLLPLIFVSCLCYAQKDFTQIVKFNFHLIKIMILGVSHTVLIVFCNIIHIGSIYLEPHVIY